MYIGYAWGKKKRKERYFDVCLLSVVNILCADRPANIEKHAFAKRHQIIRLEEYIRTPTWVGNERIRPFPLFPPNAFLSLTFSWLLSLLFPSLDSYLSIFFSLFLSYLCFCYLFRRSSVFYQCISPSLTSFSFMRISLSLQI